ncbi:MAG TPA: metal-sensitive transcriptional regulator [Marmoricola sp.]|mgnify:FL=1|jgi:DNA-binding FrmR family transcriptional regulator|nr:metal-sensitive transcriptional regulator [Nocardioidaceae bacterium]HRV69358.1 metal-sensitive transcriptional regulator [Marmoricola sp.]
MVTLNPDDMTPVINRLKRAQGQIGGVIRLIEEGRDCQAIVNQLAAVNKALDKAGYAIVSTGLRECLTNTGNPNPEEQAKMEKLFLTLS